MSAPIENVSEMSVDNEKEIFCKIEAKVATGFENVAKEEAIEKLKAETVVAKGRIIINLAVKDVPKVLELEGVDNCYVLMTQIKDFPFSDDELDCMSKLREFVREIDWQLGLMVWKTVYSFKHPIVSTPEVIPESLGEPTLSSRIHKPQKGDNQPTDKKRKGKRSRHRGHKVISTKVENIAEPYTVSNLEGDNKDVTDLEGHEIKTPSEAVHLCPDGDHITDSVSTATDQMSEKIVQETEEIYSNEKLMKNDEQQTTTKHNTTTEDINDELRTKKQRVRITEHDPMKPAFRVTCNRNGDHHSFDSMGAASNFGGAIYNYFKWNVDMKNFDIEVVLNIEENELRVCLGLTKESLHKRNLCSFGPTTLRPTIAYNLLRLCDIQPGDVVCDPMCGSGSIPVQAAVSWPESYHIAGEISHKSLVRAQENIEHVNMLQHEKNKSRLNVDCMRWDVCKLPFKDNCIDVFATDLPFGVRVGSKMNNWNLYPGAVQEMARACRLSTGRACLLTQDKKCINKAIQMFGRLWRVHKIVGINLGGLAVSAYVLHRTSLTVSQYLSEKPTTLSKQE